MVDEKKNKKNTKNKYGENTAKKYVNLREIFLSPFASSAHTMPPEIHKIYNIYMATNKIGCLLCFAAALCVHAHTTACYHNAFHLVKHSHVLLVDLLTSWICTWMKATEKFQTKRLCIPNSMHSSNLIRSIKKKNKVYIFPSQLAQVYA